MNQKFGTHAQMMLTQTWFHSDLKFLKLYANFLDTFIDFVSLIVVPTFLEVIWFGRAWNALL